MKKRVIGKEGMGERGLGTLWASFTKSINDRSRPRVHARDGLHRTLL